MKSAYIFGYGSLLNPISRAKTYSAEDVIEPVTLSGYQRILNACPESYPDIGMNLVENPDMSVVGVITRVSQEELPILREREFGYDEVEVTNQVSILLDGPVYTFISSLTDIGDRKAFQTYLDTCLGGVAPEQREQWLLETIIECDILDDRTNPQYGNYVPLDY